MKPEMAFDDRITRALLCTIAFLARLHERLPEPKPRLSSILTLALSLVVSAMLSLSFHNIYVPIASKLH